MTVIRADHEQVGADPSERGSPSERLAAFAESVPGALFTFRVLPDGSACMPFATPVMEELSGIPRAVLRSDTGPLFANVHAEDLGRIQGSIAGAVRARSRWNGEFRYLHPTRGLRWIEGWASPVAEADGGVLWHGYATDFTDRRRAELALGESESLYRSLFTLTPSGVVLLDEAGNIEAFNDQAHRQLGYTREEFGRLSVSDIDTEEAEAAILLRHLASIAKAGAEEFEARHRTSSGAIRDVHVSSRPVDVGGRKHFLAVWQDVTDRRRTAAALAESEHHYRATLQTALDGFYVTDPRGQLLEVNDAYCRMSGHGRDELLRMRIADLDCAETPLETSAHMERIRRQGAGRFESRHRRKDGVAIDVEASVTYMPGDEAKFVCFVRDITERQRAAEALRRSEAHFRALIEKSTDLIVTLDGEARYQFWSPSATEALGWTSEDMVGKLAFDFLHPDDRPRVVDLFTGSLGTAGAVVRALLRHRHRDGSWRVLEAKARNLLGDPAVRGVVVNSRDVTVQKSLEEQLKQAQRLESIGRLASGVAHDFNNILTVILSTSESVRYDLESGSGVDPRDIEEIHAAGKRARDLTRHLLTFARKQLIAPVPLDLNMLVQGSESLLRRVLREDVDLVVSLQPDLWRVRCDPGQIEQVIMNLVVNARDAMPSGGRLGIDSANVLVDDAYVSKHPFMETGAFVRLSVRDSGLGMSAEVKAHLFEPFFTTKPQGKGTGLGLATAFGIVKQSGGFIVVESDLGHGTTLDVFLPRSDEESVAD